MNKLNTTKIGDKFEEKSLEIIIKVIEDGQLGYLSDHLKITPKAKYFSRFRNDDITFDLTIEVWPPGAKRYVMIYFIECKDYETRVPVNKIEDFHSKIQQVGGVNVKGIFISNSPLQSGAYKYAESTGMMVIQGESSSDYQIMLHKRTRAESVREIPILIETVDMSLVDAGVVLIEKLMDAAILSVFSLVINESQVSYGIDRLSKENIEQIAIAELNKVNPEVMSEGYILSQITLTEYMKNQQGLKIIDISSSSDFLGSCNIESKEIGLNKSIKGTNRERFILVHELAHYILHQKLSIGQVAYDSFKDSEYNFRRGKSDLVNPRQWIEWQANYFAASFILPKEHFMYRLWLVQDDLSMSRGRIYLDDQYLNVKKFMELTTSLSNTYGVSKTTIIYRLKEMKLINNQSRLKAIGQIIGEYREDLFT